MDRSNFDIFNQITLHLLVRLFESFPNYLAVDARALGFDAIKMKDDEDFDEAWELLAISKNSVSWLQSEGFIEVEGRVVDDQINVRLTLKGLTLVGYAPPTVQDSRFENIADEAKAALVEGSRSAASDVVKGLLLRAISYIPGAFS
ncbi:hypothetical protein ACJO2E_06275 [Marinobacter sp. M1N3S26]|uniref:hypothetical protein n=1 Tax=Marinobacter sp. M1N3S26 TaxID=3382299 RepID=UPI00387ADAF7